MNAPATSAAAAVDKHRLAGLQDGVYSIGMTLLVLELKLPALAEHVGSAALWSAMLSIWPKLLTWLLSFWVLAVFWIGDARTLGACTLVDRSLLRVALVRLALVSLLPFSTALMGEHGDLAPAAALYAAHLFALALTQVARHGHLRRHAALASWPDADAAALAGRQGLIMLACTAAAFALAFVVPGHNMFALLPLLGLNLAHRLAPRRPT